MNDEREETRAGGTHFNEQDRADERGDAAEPDAPVTAEQNEGMSTILEGEPGDGVQDNLGE
ncbi:MAG TPA: hypothetical protein VJ842_09130 [Pyrinomonadaceae bacterium]|nr:hypothetical protein [Pyrinomonadaceae bacterium]